MIIDIKEKFSLFGRRYHISIDGIPSHRAKKQFISIFSTIRLYRKDELKITMIKEFGYGIETYDIILSSGTELEFKNPSGKEAIYGCQVTDDRYDIYADRGSWVRVFKNNRFHAGWEQNDIRFRNHDYQIRGEEDFDAEIVIAFCLILDDLQSIKRSQMS